MRPMPEEIRALKAVTDFAEEQFPGCVVVMHAAVCWHDDIFSHLSESDAKRLRIANKKCIRAELMPDYTVFALDDIVCAYEKTRKGRPDRCIEKNTPEFAAVAAYDKHIPYIHVDAPGFQVPKGRVTVIAIKPGAIPKAVLDHKGGAKDFNSASSRGRAVLQGRRFSTNNVFMVVDAKASVDTTMRPRAIRVASMSGHDFFRLNCSDVP